LTIGAALPLRARQAQPDLLRRRAQEIPVAVPGVFGFDVADRAVEACQLGGARVTRETVAEIPAHEQGQQQGHGRRQGKGGQENLALYGQADHEVDVCRRAADQAGTP
jgi:hypothetical protein